MLSNGIYNLVGSSIRLGINVITLPLLIKLIGISEYGIWTLVSSLAAIVSLADAGLSISTTIFISRYIASKDSERLSQSLTFILSATMAIASIAWLMVVLISPVIADFFPDLNINQREVLKNSLSISGFVIWARLIQNIMIGIGQAAQNYGWLNFLNTAQSLIYNIGLIFIAWYGGKTLNLMKWTAVFSGITLISYGILAFYLLRIFSLHLRWSNDIAKEVGRYSAFTWVGSLGSVLFSQCDRLIVGRILGTSALGVYAAITNLTTQINALSAAGVQPLLPAIGVLNPVTFNKSIKDALRLNAFIAISLGSVLYGFSPFILPLLIGLDNSQLYKASFQIAVIIYTLYSLNAVGYYLLIGMNKLEYFISVQLLSGILALSFIIIGGIQFGLKGAIFGNIGYLGIFFFTTLSMRTISVPFKIWIIWVRFPLLLFGVGLFINSILDHNVLHLIIVVLQLILLSGWAWQIYRARISQMYNKGLKDEY